MSVQKCPDDDKNRWGRYALGMLAVLQKASLVSAGCFSLKMTRNRVKP
jgi:hypothetical protein